MLAQLILDTQKKIFLKSLNGKNDLNYEQTYNFILKLNKYFEEQKIFKQKKILVIFDNSILFELIIKKSQLSNA